MQHRKITLLYIILNLLHLVVVLQLAMRTILQAEDIIADPRGNFLSIYGHTLL